MIGIKEEDVQRWKLNIIEAETYRDDNLGKYKFTERTKAGENIDYFENGISGRYINDIDTDNPLTTINLIYPIVKNVIPTLYWRNPYVNVIPKKKEHEVSAPYASAILNYYQNELDIKNVNKQIIFDAYVIGMGVCKIGYATKFGSDIPDSSIEKEREKRKEKGLLEKLGLRKPKEEEKPKQNIELNEYIRSESPYVVWVNPFNFMIDPKANSIHTANWVAEKTTKLLSEVKSNKNYSNTSSLQASLPDKEGRERMPEEHIEKLETVDLYEIHYKTDKGIRILVLAKDGDEYKALRHEDSVYEIDGFQYEILTFNKHNHRLYPKSDIDIVKGLQDRINLSLENILDQVDRYVPKIGIDETKLTEQGKIALRDGDIGAMVAFTANPSECIKELSFTQFKGDVASLIDKLFEIVMLETGLTRAQLMGMTSAQTATEAQIGQSGSNLRMSDKTDSVSDFSNKQSRKLWQVIVQFVDLEEINLITGENGIDEVTGGPKFSWMPEITGDLSEKITKGEYNFKIEVGASEKPDLPILRKQVEGLANILMGNGVMQAFQMQGYKINIAEILKRYLKLFPDVFSDIGRIIQPIGPDTKGLIQPQQGNPRGQISQQSKTPPNMADIISANEGSKGQLPLA